MSARPDAPPLVPRRSSADLSAFGVPHPAPFLLDLEIESRHLSGAIAHVSNVEYVRWLDRAAELHADALGYTRARLLEDGLMWFVARHEIDYLAEAFAGDHLLVATWVRDMQRVKSWRDSVVVRPADGQVICRAATLWVLVRLESRRPARIPSEMASVFEPLSPPLAPRAGGGGVETGQGDRTCTSR